MKRRASVILINSLTTYARMAISLVLGLLTTRTALDVLTQQSPAAKELFGVFMLLISISTATQFLNESVQQAMIRFLAISLQTENRQRTQQLFNSGWIMSTAIGLSVAVLMAAFAPWLVRVFNIPPELTTQAQTIVWLSALAQAITAMSQPWSAAISAEDRYTLLNVLYVLQQVLTLAGLNLIRFLPEGLLINLSLAWLVPGVLIGVGLAGWTMLKKPFLRLDWRTVNLRDCQQLFSLGGWSSLIGFASNLYERTDQILINLLIGPAANAIYAVTVQLGGALNRLVTSFTTVLLPTASRVSVDGSTWEKQQLILRATRYVLVLALPILVGVVIFRHQIIELWLGTGFDAAIALLPLTTFLMFCRIPIFVTWPYLTATNHLKLPAFAILLDGMFNVLLSIFYVKALNLGLAGIVLGTLSTNLIRFVGFQIPYVAKLLDLPVSQYWFSGYTRPLIPILGLAPLLGLIAGLHLSGILTLSLVMVAGILYLVAVWFCVFDLYEQKLFREMFNQLFSRTA